MTLSVLGMYDDYVRKVHSLLEYDCTREFLAFVRNQKQCQQQWKEAVDECQRLKANLDKSESQISDLEKKLTRARMILHDEKERADAAESAKDGMEFRLSQIIGFLDNIMHTGGQLASDTREQLDRLMNNANKIRFSGGTTEGLYPRLDPIDEINSTGDLLSDVSMSRSDDTLSLDTSDRMIRTKKPKRSGVVLEELPNKRRRSARLSACGLKSSGREQLIATTTVTVPPSGVITAKSRIETRPVDPSETFQVPNAPPLPLVSSSDSDAPPTPRVNHFSRIHQFEKATVLKPNECCVCLKTMSFASKSFRCVECEAIAHPQCREAVPVPCMPMIATPRGQRSLRLVDLVGPTPPLVPPILVRCVLEVERRGLNELGLYRVPGSEKDVRSLRTKFQRGKSTLSLVAYDIHVICGVLKDFLRSLPEPVITHAQWSAFTAAVRETNQDRPAALYQQVAELPPAHRDTLAFIMMHLLRVAQSPPCKMTVTNLATVFGPTLVGYSSSAPTNTELCDQTPLQAMVVESLLDLGEDYWRNVMQKPCTTPFLTPKYSMRRRNLKLFNTPPA